ncbi:RCC1 domain-containing protein [Streptomyces avermitilis]|uniref:RCC1 domain-containing protein n=1 Tax=Streptomyces avermitilis TaxID=33903 RepID=UPI0033AA5243
MSGKTWWRSARAATTPSEVTASGRVLAAGDNSYGQCEVGDWHDIVAVSAGSTHTLGLRANGTVVTAGNNADRQCEVDDWSGVQLP